MTLAHLHTSRAVVPTQTNVIEGSAQTGEGDREWYYNIEHGDKVQRNGPVSFQQASVLLFKIINIFETQYCLSCLII